LGKLNSRAAPMSAFLLTGVLASVMLLMNYNQSMAGTFTFLSVVVTAATLPLYLACSLAVLVLWKRGQHGRPGRRQILWFVAALLAAAYCIWAFVGMGAKPLLWALALCAFGIPIRLYSSRLRRVESPRI
jgi:APA family basic amino acid/polyamine antiporter